MRIRRGSGSRYLAVHRGRPGLPRLPWALDAIRIRAAAHGDTIDGLPMSDFELAYAIRRRRDRYAEPLRLDPHPGRLQLGLAAIKAVVDTGATFENGQQLRQWLNSESVTARSALPDWPTLQRKRCGRNSYKASNRER